MPPLKYIYTLLKEAYISLYDHRKRYNFVNFMNESKQWYESFLFNQCLPDNKNWRLSIFKPHLEYFSVFGKRSKLEHSKSSYKIFWTGEDTQYNYPEYKDQCINDCNISIGFDYITDVETYLRYPLWLLYYFGFCLNKDKIASMVTEFNTHTKKFNNIKNEFCAMIARHDRNGIRKKIIDGFSIIDTVFCPGSVYHNDID